MLLYPVGSGKQEYIEFLLFFFGNFLVTFLCGDYIVSRPSTQVHYIRKVILLKREIND